MDDLGVFPYFWKHPYTISHWTLVDLGTGFPLSMVVEMVPLKGGRDYMLPTTF